MNLQVLWWKVRDQVRRRWIALPVTFGAAFLAALAWTEVSIRGESGVDMARLTGLSVIATTGAFVASLAVAAIVMRRYSYQTAEVIAEKGFNALVWTMLTIGLSAIFFGIVIHGGRFGHIEVILKLAGWAKVE